MSCKATWGSTRVILKAEGVRRMHGQKPFFADMSEGMGKAK